MIIYPHIPKRKPRKPTAKQRDLRDSWDALMAKYEPKCPISSKKVKELTVKETFCRETPHYPSLNTHEGDCSKTSAQHYTGNKMMGIATLHKSNAVPVFSQEDAVEISRMRRG